MERYPDVRIVSGERVFRYRELLDSLAVHGENLKSVLKAKSKCAVLCNSGLNSAIAILACWYAEKTTIPLSKTTVLIRIVDPQTGATLPEGSPGIVEVSSPSLMKGYYNDQNLTRKTIIDGWLNTNDVGYKDKNGYLYILGRVDDMIIKAGMNIYPREIENSVNKLPEISECLAYGRKGTSGEDIIIDIVLLKESKNTNKKKLMARLGQILPSYLMPSDINIVDTLPRNASGKLIRYKRVSNE